MSHENDFIEASLKDQPVAALNAFDSMMQTKIDASLSAKAEEVRSKMFGETNDGVKV